MTKIGIVTPTFNRPELLEALHMSVLVSAVSVEFCHYVVNDGSNISYDSFLNRFNYAGSPIKYKKIANGGPLRARNVAIDMAISDRCTHIIFVDDDDLLTDGAIDSISKVLAEFNGVKWFVFASLKDADDNVVWPKNAVSMDWFKDIVFKKTLGSDVISVVAVDLMQNVRFSNFGRNQREWKFFIKLYKKNRMVLVHPTVVREVRYQGDGLTSKARGSSGDFSQIYNNLDRSINYWGADILNITLLLRLTKQLILFFPRLLALAVTVLTRKILMLIAA